MLTSSSQVCVCQRNSKEQELVQRCDLVISLSFVCVCVCVEVRSQSLKWISRRSWSTPLDTVLSIVAVDCWRSTHSHGILLCSGYGTFTLFFSRSSSLFLRHYRSRARLFSVSRPIKVLPIAKPAVTFNPHVNLSMCMRAWCCEHLYSSLSLSLCELYV